MSNYYVVNLFRIKPDFIRISPVLQKSEERKWGSSTDFHSLRCPACDITKTSRLNILANMVLEFSHNVTLRVYRSTSHHQHENVRAHHACPAAATLASSIHLCYGNMLYSTVVINEIKLMKSPRPTTTTNTTTTTTTTTTTVGVLGVRTVDTPKIQVGVSDTPQFWSAL